MTDNTDGAAGRLTGKRILITGAASGIGAATAIRVAADGADVALLDVADVGSTLRQCLALGGRAISLPCDVAQESAVQQAVDSAVGLLGGLDVVLHVAGIVRALFVPVDELELQDWDLVNDVNVTGGFLIAKYATPHLERSAGVLVLTGSGAGVWNGHRSVAYGASKGGVHGLFVTLEEPLRARGIRVHHVAPGAIDTPMVQQQVQARRKLHPDAEPSKQLTDPGAVATIMAFLASDDASAVRGTIRTW